MKIFIDDGSTNIKLAWLEDGDVKTLISPNSFKPEWSFSEKRRKPSPNAGGDIRRKARRALKINQVLTDSERRL